MAKVTVLVAVYNAEKYLPQCLDSLKGQTLRDIQVVCIDDASTDRSLQLLNDYALGDFRFDVIHLQQNRGQAHARNEGLKLARGEHICMVDADDWLEPDALEQAVNQMDEQTDCVLFSLRYDYADGRSEPYPMQPFTALTGEEAFRLSLTWKIHGLYLVRADIHRRHPYDETCRLYSDDNTTRLHYLASRQVRLSAGIYHYRQHADSMTHKVDVSRFDYLRANESMRRQLLEIGVGQDILREYECHRWLNLVGVYMFYFLHGSQLPQADRSYGLSELRRAWESIDRTSLPASLTHKFGYYPCRWWCLFRMEENLYFSLRRLLGRTH
jgi:glycosyltransferase involved in cell wall biosynthesis